MPAAWYCLQSQSENGDSRPICQPSVRSQKTRAACSGFGSSRRIENAASVATRNATRKKAFSRQRLKECGYESQSGATSSAANLVQPASATKAPRPHGELTSQKPQIRRAGMMASFVFEARTYAVKG